MWNVSSNITHCCSYCIPCGVTSLQIDVQSRWTLNLEKKSRTIRPEDWALSSFLAVKPVCFGQSMFLHFLHDRKVVDHKPTEENSSENICENSTRRISSTSYTRAYVANFSAAVHSGLWYNYEPSSEREEAISIAYMLHKTSLKHIGAATAQLLPVYLIAAE